MKFVYSPRYEADIGPHVFPTQKYRLVRDKLIQDALATEGDFVEPAHAPDADLLLVHSPDFVDDLHNLRWTRRTMSSELPLSRQIVDAYILAAGGSTMAARIAMQERDRICVHLGGGFHHAFAGHAEGFCYINDIAVAIRVMQHEHRITRASVIDCDLHQGNGTAHIFRDDPDVFTLSIHQEDNYPMKETSDVDIGLEDFTGDDDYLRALGRHYPAVLDQHKPELLVYVAGADPFEDDKLGALRVTMYGLKKRDELVIGEAVKRAIPLVVVFAGGYARYLEDTVSIHAQTCEVAQQIAGMQGES